jgi:pyridoxal phosphate enzyme (YggS family)
MTSLEERLHAIRLRIQQAARRKGHQNVQLLGVTKTVPQSSVCEAYALGLAQFGENRVQEALPKVAALPMAEWHFIGRLQTNKVKDVVGRFALIQSVDRWRLAEALQEAAQRQDQRIRILIQVNVGEEQQKGGVLPGELPDFLYDVSKLHNLQVDGLMTIPPFTENPEDARPYFKKVYRLFSECTIPGIGMHILSMGMSNDFEVAIEEGSNLVRVGSALFGERN